MLETEKRHSVRIRRGHDSPRIAYAIRASGPFRPYTDSMGGAGAVYRLLGKMRRYTRC
jgi:hypothetical protein